MDWPAGSGQAGRAARHRGPVAARGFRWPDRAGLAAEPRRHHRALLGEELVRQGAMVATRLGGSAGAGSRRGLHEAIPDPAYAIAQREAAPTRFAPPPADIRDTAPGWRSVPD